MAALYPVISIDTIVVYSRQKSDIELAEKLAEPGLSIYIIGSAWFTRGFGEKRAIEEGANVGKRLKKRYHWAG